MRPTKVISVVGPTATGKTALGIALAKALSGEIISSDSRQVYRGLNLGTGKVTAEEADGVPHHLIDIREPNEQYTVYDFVNDGRAAIAEIAARGKVPIIVGGTGLYVDALLGRVTLDAPPADPEVRAELANLSPEELREKLLALDPARFAATDVQNPRRLMRALEITLSGTAPGHIPPATYDVTWLGLTMEREWLKQRIEERLASRLAAGMLDEARVLHANGLSFERMEALGLEYRYMARHLEGQTTYEEMTILLKTEIFKYAKRQMTWFKRNKDITWLDAENVPPIDSLVRLV